MKIILSPTKQMKQCEYFDYKSIPMFESKAKKIADVLKKMSYDELKKVMNCSDALMNKTIDYYKRLDFKHGLSPALFSYDGIAYKYLGSDVLDDDSLNYLNDYLFILSGLYGVLRPFDGVGLYRLEMGARFLVDGKSIYDFYSKDVKELLKDEDCIINLASKEYSILVENNISDNTKIIDVVFASRYDGKLKVKATEAKMARGSMVRYMAENKITDIEKIKDFNLLDFEYSEEDSNENKIVFIKKGSN